MSIRKLVFAIFFVLISLGTANLLFIFKSNAQILIRQNLDDSRDTFVVMSPLPNTILRGTVNISWIMSDNDQSQIAFKVDLNDRVACTTRVSTILESIGPSSLNTYNHSWNTINTQNSGVVDGIYCLRICLKLKNNDNEYDACNGRIVRLVNNNTLPVITSSPNRLTINETESWSYQIIASDAQGDPLKYRIIQGAPFLVINETTGLISTNSFSRVLPQGIYKATYTIIIAVDDGISGEVRQQFELSIVKPLPPPKPKTPQEQPKNQPNQPNPKEATGTVPSQNSEESRKPVNSPTKISFLNIEQGKVIDTESFEMHYTLSDPEGINLVEIFLVESESKKEKKLSEMNSDNLELKKVINFKDLPNGSYLIKINVRDNADILTSKESNVFMLKITPQSSSPSQSGLGEALIVDNLPADKSQIYERKPSISGKFIPSKNGKVLTETFKFFINNENFLDSCNLDENGFVCVPEEPLSFGTKTIKAYYKDSNSKEANLSWEIEIKDISKIDLSTENRIEILGQKIPLATIGIVAAICCITIVLLVTPWILVNRIIKGRKTTEKIYVSDDISSVSDELDEFLKNVNVTQKTEYAKEPPNITAEFINTKENEKTAAKTDSLDIDEDLLANSVSVDDYLSYISPNNNVSIQDPVEDNSTKTQGVSESVTSSSKAKTQTDEFFEPTPADLPDSTDTNTKN
ncbi:hypothetical protein D6810_01845 [Candidatus Dojkabacteria bacterium]|uniref:Cadherin repeat domain-containing protein n=1 Tax=Candidatus Dojkabacteria bacterium TaxID=2099670 RepID=A0A3M0YYC9_9BACT|nr:MAG: hypothetical protein D6810_01845 [Candidatus Dojkabacteria bacterium]